MYANTVSNLFGSSSTLSPSATSIRSYCDGTRSIRIYCDGRCLHLSGFLSNEASSFLYYYYILINCCILERFYLLSVIKNELHVCFIRKPRILSCIVRANRVAFSNHLIFYSISLLKRVNRFTFIQMIVTFVCDVYIMK
jgi:hypothetical protein